MAKRNYNTFSWSGGQVRLNSTGQEFNFVAGDTDAALTAAGYTVTGGTWGDGTQNNPMQPYKQYVIYIDTLDDTTVEGFYTVRIGINDYGDFGYRRQDSYIEIAYITTGTNVDLGIKTIGLPGSSFYTANIDCEQGLCEVEFLYAFSNVWGLGGSIMSPSSVLQPGSISAALLRKGARPFTSNLSFAAYNNSYNQVQWDNGAGGSVTISFGDAGTGSDITVVAGNSQTSPNAFTFSAGTTYYAYMIPDTDSRPRFTSNYTLASTDDAFLVAIITIDSDTGQKSPTILPIYSKTPTLSAVAIAADAVVANHIKAGSLDAKTITLTGNDGKIRTSSGVDRNGSGNPTGTGLVINNSGIVGVNSGTKQFEIRATTGKAEFGEGACVLDNMGLWMKDQDHPINFQHGTGSTDDYYYSMWGQSSSGHNRILFASREDDGTYITDPEVNYLAPHVPGEIGLGGPQTGPWGTIYANTHYISIKASVPSAATATNWGALYIRGTTLYMKIGTTEYSVGSGSATVGYPLTATDGSAGSPSYTFSLDTNTGIFRLSNDKLGLVANGQQIILDGTSGAARLGIGTSTPSHILHVNGVALSTQATWATSSDERVKENIVDMEPALDTLLQLKPRRFNFKDSYRPNRKDTEVGFIAQEVKEAIDKHDASDYGAWNADGDGRQRVSREQFVVSLVKAVQELSAKVEELEAKLK